MFGLREHTGSIWKLGLLILVRADVSRVDELFGMCW